MIKLLDLDFGQLPNVTISYENKIFIFQFEMTCYI